MTIEIIFDDTITASAELQALVGVKQFGSLVYRRRSRLDAMRELARETHASLLHLAGPDDRAALVARLREEDFERLFLLCPSNVVPTCSAATLATFVRQAQYAPTGLHLPLDGARDRRGWVVMRSSLLTKYLAKQNENDVAGFFEQNGDRFVEVRDRLGLIDVSDERALLDYLSGQFDARHFNAIEHDEHTVLKRSKDRLKLRREYEFHRLVPAHMQMFLVQPFDFQDDGETASYRMERLSVPDMALQWVHNSFQPNEFERFLKHIFYFLSIRPSRRADKAQMAAVRDGLYIDKVDQRIAALKAAPEYEALRPLLERACGGVDALVARYRALYERHRNRFPNGALVVGHGDPCFSNILYSKTNQHLKLIDPRGAANDDELYTDPYYDVAKLSHSIMGGYDFINQDMFDIGVDERLRLQLALENPPPAWAATMFAERLAEAGFDMKLTRLCEASLFISMLPLHIDRPRKVLAFAINAATILDYLSGSQGDPS